MLIGMLIYMMTDADWYTDDKLTDADWCWLMPIDTD